MGVSQSWRETVFRLKGVKGSSSHCPSLALLSWITERTEGNLLAWETTRLSSDLHHTPQSPKPRGTPPVGRRGGGRITKYLKACGGMRPLRERMRSERTGRGRREKALGCIDSPMCCVCQWRSMVWKAAAGKGKHARPFALGSVGNRRWAPSPERATASVFSDESHSLRGGRKWREPSGRWLRVYTCWPWNQDSREHGGNGREGGHRRGTGAGAGDGEKQHRAVWGWVDRAWFWEVTKDGGERPGCFQLELWEKNLSVWIQLEKWKLKPKDVCHLWTISSLWTLLKALTRTSVMHCFCSLRKLRHRPEKVVRVRDDRRH